MRALIAEYLTEQGFKVISTTSQIGEARRVLGQGHVDLILLDLKLAHDGLDLTKGEFGLLTAFLTSPQRVLSREQLLAATRVHDQDVYDRSVDVQILRLRRKLEANPSEPELIRTVRGAATSSPYRSTSCQRNTPTRSGTGKQFARFWHAFRSACPRFCGVP